MSDQQKREDLVVRIGGGTKLHPAYIDEHGWLMFRCSCGGTQSGRARHSATVFRGRQATCGNR